MAISDLKIDKNARVAVKHVSTALATIVASKTDRPARVITPGYGWRLLRVLASCLDVTGSVALKVKKVPSTHSGVVSTTAGLAINAAPEKFNVGAFVARVAGVWVEKAAQTAITFTAAHVISATKFGVILVQMDNAGTVSTKVPLATQAYADAATALAALPSPDAGNISLGYIAIAAGALAWTANTDDMTNGSDVTTASFNNTAVAATVVDLLQSAVSYADGTVAEGTLVTDTTKLTGAATDDIVVSYTSDGTGALVNGFVDVMFRPYPLARG